LCRRITEEDAHPKFVDWSTFTTDKEKNIRAQSILDHYVYIL